MEDFSLFDGKCDARHNITAFLDDSKETAIPFRPMVAFLRRSRIITAITESPTIYRDHVGQFWRNVIVNTENETTRLLSRVHDRPVIITEQMIREVLRFDDHPDMPIQFPNSFIVGAMNRMGFVGKHSDQYRKGFLTRVWRWLMHIIILCISNRRAGYDGASHRTVSAMLALVYNKPYNFSGYIFRSMVDNAQLGHNAWYMYPRFVQMLLNRELPGLPTRETHVYRQTPMSNRIFGVMSADGKNVAPRDDTPLFGHIIDPNYQPPPNDEYLDPVVQQPIIDDANLADIPVHSTEDPLEDLFINVDSQGELQTLHATHDTSEDSSDSDSEIPGGLTESDSEGLVPHPREMEHLRISNPRGFLRVQRRMAQGRQYVPARDKRVRQSEDDEYVPPPPKKSKAARQVSSSSQPRDMPRVEVPVRPSPDILQELKATLEALQKIVFSQAARIESVEKENEDLRSRVVKLES